MGMAICFFESWDIYCLAPEPAWQKVNLHNYSDITFTASDRILQAGALAFDDILGFLEPLIVLRQT